MPSHKTALKREMNPEVTQQVTLRLNTPQIEIINRLYKTGLWGNTTAKVVDRLLCEALAKHAEPPTVTAT